MIVAAVSCSMIGASLPFIFCAAYGVPNAAACTSKHQTAYSHKSTIQRSSSPEQCPVRWSAVRRMTPQSGGGRRAADCNTISSAAQWSCKL